MPESERPNVFEKRRAEQQDPYDRLTTDMAPLLTVGSDAAMHGLSEVISLMRHKDDEPPQQPSGGNVEDV